MKVIRLREAIYLKCNITLRLLRLRFGSEKNLSDYLRHIIALHQKRDGLLLHKFSLFSWQTPIR
jgi:hypothetical protein